MEPEPGPGEDRRHQCHGPAQESHRKQRGARCALCLGTGRLAAQRQTTVTGGALSLARPLVPRRYHFFLSLSFPHVKRDLGVEGRRQRKASNSRPSPFLPCVPGGLFGSLSLPLPPPLQGQQFLTRQREALLGQGPGARRQGLQAGCALLGAQDSLHLSPDYLDMGSQPL